VDSLYSYFILQSVGFWKNFGKAKEQAGKKEWGLGEGIFVHPLILDGGWVCVAEGNA